MTNPDREPRKPKASSKAAKIDESNSKLLKGRPFSGQEFPSPRHSLVFTKVNIVDKGHDGSHATPSTRNPDPQVGQRPAQIIYDQANQFLQQLKTFEDLLKGKTLKPAEQVKGLSQLREALDMLAWNFRTMRHKHDLLLCENVKMSQFDPERELEGLIFQFGLHLDELEEQVDQMVKEQPTCKSKAPLPPPPQSSPSSFSSEIEEKLTHLQDYCIRLLVSYSDKELTIDELRLQVMINETFGPPKPEHTLQSELNQRAKINSESLHSTAQSTHQESSSACSSLRSPDPQVGQQPAQIIYDQADQFRQQLETFEDLLKGKTLKPAEQVKGLSQLREALDSLERGYMSMCKEQKRQLQEGVKIKQLDPERKLEGLIFQFGLHLDELKEQVDQMVKEQPTCKSKAPLPPPPQPNPSFVPSEIKEKLTRLQEVTVSLLMDSRSESSRLTPAAAPSPLHQRASESVSVPKEWNPVKPQIGLVSAPSPASLPSHRCTAVEDNVGSRSTGDSLRALGSSQVPYHNDTIQRMQDELTKMKKGIGRCQRLLSPESSVKAAPSALKNCPLNRTTTPGVRFDLPVRDVSCGRREVDYDSMRRTASERPPRPPPPYRRTLQPDISAPSALHQRAPSALKNCPPNRTTTPHIRSQQTMRDVSSGGRGVDYDTMRRIGIDRPPSPLRQKSQPRIYNRRYAGSQTETSRPPAKFLNEKMRRRLIAAGVLPAPQYVLPVGVPPHRLATRTRQI